MRYITARDPNLPRFGAEAPPEDPFSIRTCACGHVIRLGEEYGWWGGELRCEKCMENIKMVLPVRIKHNHKTV